jgi:CubicO group peptidase (beta-lactamase class C family)
MNKPLLSIVMGACFACGAGLPTVAPEREGFSAERLNKINVVMKQHVDAGRLAGASGLLVRNGKIVFRETWGEMKPDSIVRMYSMTKGVTGVAAMILYEEGKFAMTDPVSKYLPEFAHMRVGRESTDAAGKKIYYSVPATREITCRDLFRHTTGLDYAGPKDENGEPAYKKIEMVGGAPQVPFDLAEAVKRLATAPLNDEPGTMFRYGYSIDVLGRLVEVLSGKPLDQFFEERIFRPLGMKDTGFFVPEEKWSRLATLYVPKKDGAGIERTTAPPQESFKKKPALLLGGAGLTSTLEDYSHFYAMLLNDGQYDGARILGRKSVELMRSDHLGSIPHAGLLPEWEGFGLTFAVNPGPGKSPDVGSAGSYRWGGAAGTSFWLDPKENMFGIFLIQILPPNVGASGEFQRLAYTALVN